MILCFMFFLFLFTFGFFPYKADFLIYLFFKFRDHVLLIDFVMFFLIFGFKLFVQTAEDFFIFEGIVHFLNTFGQFLNFNVGIISFVKFHVDWLGRFLFLLTDGIFQELDITWLCRFSNVF